MNNYFRLALPDTSITALCGNACGRRIFEEQLKGKIDYSSHITIVMPETVNSIASSFIQGFFAEIVENIGVDGIKNQVDVLSLRMPDVKEQIMCESR